MIKCGHGTEGQLQESLQAETRPVFCCCSEQTNPGNRNSPASKMASSEVNPVGIEEV